MNATSQLLGKANLRGKSRLIVIVSAGGKL
jgi:hypothetical protein